MFHVKAFFRVSLAQARLSNLGKQVGAYQMMADLAESVLRVLVPLARGYFSPEVSGVGV